MGRAIRLACFTCMVVATFSAQNGESYNVRQEVPETMRGAFFKEIGGAPVKIVLSDLYDKGKQGLVVAKDKAAAAQISNGMHRVPHRMHFVVLWMLRRLFAANQIFGYINTRFWAEVDAMLDIYMRRWYDALPVRNMRVIVHKALTDIYTLLEPRMAGTQSLEALDDILTDPESIVLKIWTSKSCMEIATQCGSFSAANALLTKKFGDPLPFGHNVRRAAGVNPEEDARRIAQSKSAPLKGDKPMDFSGIKSGGDQKKDE